MYNNWKKIQYAFQAYLKKTKKNISNQEKLHKILYDFIDKFKKQKNFKAIFKNLEIIKPNSLETIKLEGLKYKDSNDSDDENKKNLIQLNQLLNIMRSILFVNYHRSSYLPKSYSGKNKIFINNSFKLLIKQFFKACPDFKYHSPLHDLLHPSFYDQSICLVGSALTEIEKINQKEQLFLNTLNFSLNIFGDNSDEKKIINSFINKIKDNKKTIKFPDGFYYSNNKLFNSILNSAKILFSNLISKEQDKKLFNNTFVQRKVKLIKSIKKLSFKTFFLGKKEPYKKTAIDFTDDAQNITPDVFFERATIEKLITYYQKLPSLRFIEKRRVLQSIDQLLQLFIDTQHIPDTPKELLFSMATQIHNIPIKSKNLTGIIDTIANECVRRKDYRSAAMLLQVVLLKAVENKSYVYKFKKIWDQISNKLHEFDFDKPYPIYEKEGLTNEFITSNQVLAGFNNLIREEKKYQSFKIPILEDSENARFLLQKLNSEKDNKSGASSLIKEKDDAHNRKVFFCSQLKFLLKKNLGILSLMKIDDLEKHENNVGNVHVFKKEKSKNRVISLLPLRKSTAEKIIKLNLLEKESQFLLIIEKLTKKLSEELDVCFSEIYQGTIREEINRLAQYFVWRILSLLPNHYIKVAENNFEENEENFKKFFNNLLNKVNRVEGNAPKEGEVFDPDETNFFDSFCIKNKDDHEEKIQSFLTRMRSIKEENNKKRMSDETKELGKVLEKTKEEIKKFKTENEKLLEENKKINKELESEKKETKKLGEDLEKAKEEIKKFETENEKLLEKNKKINKELKEKIDELLSSQVKLLELKFSIGKKKNQAAEHQRKKNLIVPVSYFIGHIKEYINILSKAEESEYVKKLKSSSTSEDKRNSSPSKQNNADESIKIKLIIQALFSLVSKIKLEIEKILKDMPKIESLKIDNIDMSCIQLMNAVYDVKEIYDVTEENGKVTVLKNNENKLKERRSFTTLSPLISQFLKLRDMLQEFDFEKVEKETSDFKIKIIPLSGKAIGDFSSSLIDFNTLLAQVVFKFTPGWKTHLSKIRKYSHFLSIDIFSDEKNVFSKRNILSSDLTILRKGKEKKEYIILIKKGNCPLDNSSNGNDVLIEDDLLKQEIDQFLDSRQMDIKNLSQLKNKIVQKVKEKYFTDTESIKNIFAKILDELNLKFDEIGSSKTSVSIIKMDSIKYNLRTQSYEEVQSSHVDSKTLSM